MTAGSREPAMNPLKTLRMRLVPGTRSRAEVELSDPARLASLLGAVVPASWPPESVRDALPQFLERCRESGDRGPWTLGWYGILDTREGGILCGSAGFKGPPTAAGMVEIGYSVLPDHQGRGIATEMVVALSQWALSQPGVTHVEAEVALDNMASMRVLEKAGFAPCGAGADPGAARYRRGRHASA